MLEKNALATEYFRMLNPIEHARTREDAMKYKAEPYVIVADIYSHPHLIGRGGWSWYTGSASWYYLAGVKYILGLQKKGNYLEINPHFPKEWKDCYIQYQVEKTEYKIHILRQAESEELLQSESAIRKLKKMIYFDNELLEGEAIPIILDDRVHQVEVLVLDEQNR